MNKLNISSAKYTKSGDILAVINDREYTFGTEADYNSVYGVCYPGTDTFKMIYKDKSAAAFWSNIKEQVISKINI